MKNVHIQCQGDKYDRWGAYRPVLIQHFFQCNDLDLVNHLAVILDCVHVRICSFMVDHFSCPSSLAFLVSLAIEQVRAHTQRYTYDSAPTSSPTSIDSDDDDAMTMKCPGWSFTCCMHTQAHLLTLNLSGCRMARACTVQHFNVN